MSVTDIIKQKLLSANQKLLNHSVRLINRVNPCLFITEVFSCKNHHLFPKINLNTLKIFCFYNARDRKTLEKYLRKQEFKL